MKRKLTANALLLLGSDGGSRLLTFLANVYLARTLGTEEYGTVFLAMTFLSVALQSGDLGLAMLGTREAAKPEESREFAPGELHTLRVLLGAGAATITGIVVLAAVHDGTARSIALMFLLGVIPTFFQLEWFFQGKRRYGVVAVVRYVFAAAYLAGIWFLVDSAGDLLRVPMVYVGALAISGITALSVAVRTDRLSPVRSWFGREQRNRWRSILKRSAPIGLGGSVTQVVQLLPPMVIAAMYSQSEVGEFGAAFRLAINLMILDRAFIALFLPAVSGRLADNREASVPFLRSTFRWVAAGAIGLGLLVTLLAVPVMDIIYGDQYADAAIPLAVMSWFVSATLLNSFFSMILVAAGIEKSYFHSSLISSAIGSVLIVLLTWQFGIVGAAVGMSVSEILMASLMYRQYNIHVGLRLR